VKLEFAKPGMIDLSEVDLDRLQTETDDLKVYKWLTFLKHLYDSGTLAEAAGNVGVFEGTASSWVH
jgi:hypothetical protein